MLEKIEGKQLVKQNLIPGVAVLNGQAGPGIGKRMRMGNYDPVGQYVGMPVSDRTPQHQQVYRNQENSQNLNMFSQSDHSLYPIEPLTGRIVERADAFQPEKPPAGLPKPMRMIFIFVRIGLNFVRMKLDSDAHRLEEALRANKKA